MSRYDDFIKYRQQYPVFEYNGFDYHIEKKILYVTYSFNIPGLTSFEPKWEFPIHEEPTKDTLEVLLFNLGMAESISYWKATCSPIFKCYANLNDEQISWWKKLWQNGLGEFLYKNDIFNNIQMRQQEAYVNGLALINIECQEKQYNCSSEKVNLEGQLIPVGGGKDSVVTMSLLKELQQKNTVYIINPRGASRDCAKIGGYDNSMYCPNRSLSPQLLKLNEQGFLNGHTPFSAIVAFSAFVSAYLLNKKYIVLSNEDSSNEGNVIGTNINHQYSKSIEFENDFIFYSKKYMMSNAPMYFSLLRPFSEWQIVKEFVKHPEFFGTFKSCNVGSKQDVWCNNCPKCLYVYIMLKGFLEEKQLLDIFGVDMLNDNRLKEIYEGLIKQDFDKPFECVGTKEEIVLSLNTIWYDKPNKKYSLMSDFAAMKYEEYIKLKEKYTRKYEENNIPECFVKYISSIKGE